MVVGPSVTRYELELGPGREGRSRHEPPQGHRLRDGVARRPHPGADPRSPGDRRRGAQHRPPDRGARRHPRLGGGQAGHPPPRGGGGSRHQRQGRDDEPRHHAAPPDRRGHRRRQVELPQLDHHVDPHAVHARPGAHDPRRPEARRDGPVRPAAAPAHPGGHQPEEGGQRAGVGRARDGASLRPPRRGRLPRHHRLQRRLRPRRPARRRVAQRRGAAQLPAAAVHPRGDRRAVRPHDGGGPRRRGLDLPHRPDGARRGHPPRDRHAAPVGERDHRRDQGQRAGPPRLRGVERHRQPRASSTSRAPSGSSAPATCSCSAPRRRRRRASRARG